MTWAPAPSTWRSAGAAEGRTVRVAVLIEQARQLGIAHWLSDRLGFNGRSILQHARAEVSPLTLRSCLWNDALDEQTDVEHVAVHLSDQSHPCFLLRTQLLRNTSMEVG